MAGCPQCQDLERERKSLEGELPGNSNSSRDGLKCAEESYESPFLIMPFCFCNPDHVSVGLGILEFRSSMVGMAVVCRYLPTLWSWCNSWVNYSPVNEFIHLLIPLVTPLPSLSPKLGMLAPHQGMSSCPSPAQWRLSLKLPPKSKVQWSASLGWGVLCSFSCPFQFFVFPRTVVSVRVSLGMKNTRGIHWHCNFVLLK